MGQVVRSADLTVLFATRNGERVVGRTLEGYCKNEAPSVNWKIVVVDNGSTDSTSGVIESFKDRLPLELLHQPIPGKNCALNLGLSAVEGSAVILTDDDAIPNPNFLKAWVKGLNGSQEYELFGGSIEPLFETPPPSWLKNDRFYFDMLFVARSLPEGPIEPEDIFGPNMAIRASVFKRGFRFNENIGPNGSDANYPMGSETEFCCRLVQSGAKCWFAKEPLVYHIVHAHQMRMAYWVKRAYRHGRGFAQQKWESGQLNLSQVSRPYPIRVLSRLRRRLRTFSLAPARRFKTTCDYHWSMGYDDECARLKMNGGH